MTRQTLAAAAFVLLVSTCAFAQAPGPGWVQMGDGGWLPCSNPVATTHPGCAGTETPRPELPVSIVPPRIVVPPASADLTGCDHPNPYVAGPNTTCILGTYLVGRVYRFGTVERAVVLGVTLSPLGVEIVTVQFLDLLGTHRGGPDHVWAFANDGRYRPWTMTTENGF